MCDYKSQLLLGRIIQDGGRGRKTLLDFRWLTWTKTVQKALALRKRRSEEDNHASNAMYLPGIRCLIDVLLLPLTRVIEMKLHLQERK